MIYVTPAPEPESLQPYRKTTLATAIETPGQARSDDGFKLCLHPEPSIA
jgi:hypothetical protein